MTISPLQISSILGSNYQSAGNSSVANIINGSSDDVSLSLLPFSSNNNGQGSTDNLAGLEKFIKSEVSSEDDAKKLLASVQALRSLLNGKGSRDAGLDPIFSLLAGSSVAAGSLVNELV